MKLTKIFAVAALVLSGANLTHAQEMLASDAPRIAPLSWWIGMNNPTVQLMVFHKDLGNRTPKINHKGVELEKVHRVDNSNYLFLDLKIDPKTKAGEFNIVFSEQGKSDIVMPYTLAARDVKQKKAQGVTNEDFIYLIMPDRFANGDPSNDVVKSARETAMNRDSLYYRHGGDIQGVINQLDYLKDMGVTAVWLNPVLTNDMEKASYHGYAATEFYQIDPRLGTNDLYRKLADELHKRDMKLIQDLVHNHVGAEHWTVKEQPYKDWLNNWDEYTNTTYKDQVLFDPYAAQSDKRKMTDGWFVPSMPDLNQRTEFMQNYITQSHIWWIEYAGVDGFRLDTYAYNDADYMAKWAQDITAEYPSMTYFGETWVHGIANQAVFTEGSTVNQHFDTHLQAVTDFQTYHAINKTFTEPFGWTEGVNALYSTLANDYVYKDPTRNVVFLDNHDVSRFLSIVGEDINKYKSGLTWLLTTRGIPQLYYGAEIAMKNFADPDGKVREDFPGGWAGDKQNKFRSEGRNDVENEVFDHVKKLATYRKDNAVLQTGKLMQFVPEDGIYVYFRYDDQKTIMVIMNTNEGEKTIKTERFAERVQKYTSGLDVVAGNEVDIKDQVTVPGFTAITLELR
ncbi:glycoside hydrolase family 13 protein [Sphingobacterium sp. lm-10]|uniref:glycoside hydrolase family 13 protein n=1 Tax=Sphingobacterium sp. lm-10 TaxID=2944904 RepID=UPI002020EA88|nr:glycoside hydrolase family 13 protein [Sphingobacterium sp. lm-10]MCL7989198.1 glycoside hydrolase family 13 protein [Sphingobacterium sp. lm-10]